MKRLVVLLASLGLTPLLADYVLDFSVANPDNGNKKDTRVITDVQITTKEFTLEAWVRRNGNQAGFKIFAQYNIRDRPTSCFWGRKTLSRPRWMCS